MAWRPQQRADTTHVVLLIEILTTLGFHVFLSSLRHDGQPLCKARVIRESRKQVFLVEGQQVGARSGAHTRCARAVLQARNLCRIPRKPTHGEGGERGREARCRDGHGEANTNTNLAKKGARVQYFQKVATF